MSALSPITPQQGDSVGILMNKWLQVIRSQKSNTDPLTVPDLNDPIGQTLIKILKVYLG